MGVLASHVPSIEQLKPGVVEVIEESSGSKSFFRMCRIYKFGTIRLRRSLVSGGFAVVQPGSKLSINAVEGFPLEDFSAEVSLLARRRHTQSLTTSGCPQPDFRGSEDRQRLWKRAGHC